MKKSLAKSPLLQIHETRDSTRQILLHPENDDVFVRTGRQVIEACRLGISLELWFEELNSMLEEVRRWHETRHDERVRCCVCAAHGGKISLFFIPSSGHFDFDLADNLADLNTLLVRKYNVGMIEVGQIPWEEFERFVAPESFRLIYGESPTTHRTVEA